MLLVLRLLLPIDLLGDDLVLLVHIDNVDETFLVSSVQLLFLLVPTDAGVDTFIRILHSNLLCTFCGLKPLEFLVVTDCEDKVFA